jgi:predicted DNA-binding transcriptional regulator AlpA
LKVLKVGQDKSGKDRRIKLPDVTATFFESAAKDKLTRAATGLGRSTIYRLIADDSFPAPVRPGPRAVAWRWSDLDQWVPIAPRHSLSWPLSRRVERQAAWQHVEHGDTTGGDAAAVGAMIV